MIYYIVAAYVLGIISSGLLFTSAFGLNDAKMGVDREWYENVMSLIILTFATIFIVTLFVTACSVSFNWLFNK
jgi:hypothetical protein